MTLSKDQRIAEAVEIMRSKGYHKFPITEKGRDTARCLASSRRAPKGTDCSGSGCRDCLRRNLPVRGQPEDDSVREGHPACHRQESGT